MSAEPIATAPLVLTTGIIDLFHGDVDAIRKRGTTLDQALADAKSDGIVHVIAKCAQGKDYVDPAWMALADSTRKVGLGFSAYFFPSMTADGPTECDWFAKCVEAAGFTLPELMTWFDKERNPNKGGTVTMANARAWVQHYRDRFARWPGYYSNTSDLHSNITADDVIRNCPLWVAAYGNFVPHGPRTPDGYPWSLWQYMGAESTEANEFPHDQALYPRTAKGIEKVDRNVFRGTPDQLAEFMRTAGR